MSTVCSLTEEQWKATPPEVRDFFMSLAVEMREKGRQDPNAEAYIDNLLTSRSVKPHNINQVIFVNDLPSTRVVKLGYALKKLGFEVGLLYQQNFYGDISKYFSFYEEYSGAASAVIKAVNFNPLCYHMFSSWDFHTATRLIIHRPGPVVFDDYDILNGTLQQAFVRSNDKTLKAKFIGEQYCLKHSDGLVCRNTTLRGLARQNKINFVPHPRKVFFPEYCWGPNAPATADLLPKRSDGVHLVYVGHVNADKFFSPKMTNCYDKLFVESLTSKGLHYHLYPSPIPGKTTHAAYPWLAEYEAANPLFHLHGSLPCDELIREISQYHFGLFSVPQQIVTEGDEIYESLYHNTLVPNKVFDYLDAELPVVLNSSALVNWLVDRLGAAVRCDSHEAAQMLSSERVLASYPELLQGAQRAKHAYAVDKQAARLVKFYRSVAKVECASNKKQSKIAPRSVSPAINVSMSTTATPLADAMVYLSTTSHFP